MVARSSAQNLLAAHSELAEDPDLLGLIDYLEQDRDVIGALSQRNLHIESGLAGMRDRLEDIDLSAVAGARESLTAAQASAETAASAVGKMREGMLTVNSSIAAGKKAIRASTDGAWEIVAAALDALDAVVNFRCRSTAGYGIAANMVTVPKNFLPDWPMG